MGLVSVLPSTVEPNVSSPLVQSSSSVSSGMDGGISSRKMNKQNVVFPLGLAFIIFS